MILNRTLLASLLVSALTLIDCQAGLAQTSAAIPTITSFAGTGAIGFSGDGGPATQALINNPSGITVDSSGNVYFTDANNYRVRKISTSGVISTVAGGVANSNTSMQLPPGPAVGFELYNPTAIATAGGSIYFADLGIAVVNSSGTLTEDYANSAVDLVSDASGNVYGIYAGSAVYKYTPGGAPQVLAGTLTPTGASSSGDGGPALKATFASASALAVDAQGNIYVADSNDNTVRKFQPGGTITTVAGSLTATPPSGIGPAIGDGGPATQAPLQISSLNGSIAVDPSGNLYIAETLNRIRKVSTSGVIQTYAGSGSSGRYFGDGGPALQAIISPQNIATDTSGNLYVVNVTNGEQRILKIALQSSTGTGGGTPTLPVIAAVISAAANLPAVTPGGFVSLYGTNFTAAGDSRGWSLADFAGGLLPTSLDGVSVTIDGKPAGVSYISPNQLNVLVPDDSAVGPVNVVVSNSAGSSAPFSVAMVPYSPAFFTLDGNHVIAQHLDYTLVAPVGFGGTARPASAGETIIIYGTGFGATNPPTPFSSLVAATAPLANPVTVTVGGISATVLYVGIDAIGEYQLNVTLPPSPFG